MFINCAISHVRFQDSKVNLWLTNCFFFLPVGRGGASIYGKQFEDELHPELKFTGKISKGKENTIHTLR